MDRCVGLDIEKSPYWQEVREEDVKFIVGDARILPLQDEIFDYIFAKDVLHHISEHKKVLREILRVTKEGGRIILIEANRYNPISFLHLTLLKKHQHFTKSYFRELVGRYANDIDFFSCEAHVVPIKNKRVRRFIYYLEDLAEKVPLFQRFLSYNIAIMKKSEKGSVSGAALITRAFQCING